MRGFSLRCLCVPDSGSPLRSARVQNLPDTLRLPLPVSITLRLSAQTFICHYFAQLPSLDSMSLASVCVDFVNQNRFV